MCVFDFLFSLPVLVAVAWRFCMTNAQPPKKKKKNWGQKLSLSLSAHRTQTRRKRGLFLVVLFSVCVPSVLAVSVCVLRPFVVDFGCFRGMDLLVVCVCVCFCLKRALALSLSVRSHCLCLGLSRFLPFFSPLALSLSDLHLSLITFTRKYYLLLCFVLLPLICNNSCILRDATVCVLCAVQKREVCPICLPACCMCTVLFFFVELWFLFYLQ